VLGAFIADREVGWARRSSHHLDQAGKTEVVLPRMPRWLGEMLAVPIRNVPVRIRSGPNAGLRWSLAVAGRRGYLNGTYEGPRFEVLRRLMAEGDCFWDVGAHQGYVALAAAQAVGPHGRVFSFEPSAHNGWYLRTHVRWSKLPNITIMPVAVGAADGSARFGGSQNSVLFRVGEGNETVEVRSVDSLVADGLPPPTFLKADVESSEVELLRGAARTLPQVDVAVISVHSMHLYRQCVTLLEKANLVVYHSPRIARVLAGLEPWGGDPDIVGLGPRAEARHARLEAYGGFQPADGKGGGGHSPTPRRS
jgi:FkbM family methyltransferase